MFKNVTEVNQSDYMWLCRQAIATEENVAVFAPAGTGKTEMATQVSTAFGHKHCYLNASVLEAPEMQGLPKIDEVARKTKYFSPEFFPMADETTDKYVMVVDEIDKLKPELQAPMLELFSKTRSINGRKTAITSCIATGNMMDENAFSQPVSHALMNRCMVFQMNCEFEPWRDHAVKSNVNGLIVGFLSQNPDRLLTKTDSSDETAYSKESPRSWLKASNVLNYAVDESIDRQVLLISGFVGVDSAIKFKVWLEFYRFAAPTIEALVKEGKKPNLKDMSTDKIIVCSIAAAGEIMKLCNSATKSEKDKKALQKEIERVTKNVFMWYKDIPIEFVLAGIKSTMNTQTIHNFQLIQIPCVLDMLKKLQLEME